MTSRLDTDTLRSARLGLRLLAFGRDQAGGVLLVVGLGAPLLFGAVAAAVTYGQLTARRAQLQAAADGGVLAAARELTLANASDSQVVSVARNSALAMLAKNQPLGTQASPEPAIVKDAKGQRSGVDIVVTETVATPLGKLLSYPNFTLVVRAEAKLSGSTKVCLIGLDDRVRGTVKLRKDAQITASTCALYSNSKDPEGLTADDNATVVAALVCSSGGLREGKKGASFRPEPVTDCPVLPDPLIGRAAPSYPGVCSPINEVKGPAEDKKDGKGKAAPTAGPKTLTDTGSGIDLAPGLYCEGLKVTGGATVRLKPGIFVMRGPLVVDGSALTGQNVGLYFEGDKASLLFETDSSISLTAPKDGDMAGLLMFEERRVSFPDTAPGGKTKGRPRRPLPARRPCASTASSRTTPSRCSGRSTCRPAASSSIPRSPSLRNPPIRSWSPA